MRASGGVAWSKDEEVWAHIGHIVSASLCLGSSS